MRSGTGWTKSRLAAASVPLVMLTVLTACGGGGGGEGGGTAQPLPSPSTPASPAPQTVPGSSLLKDNAPGASGRYDNFASEQVTVPVDRHAFSGRRVFVKVASPDGQVLFLGEVAPSLPFSLQVQVPVGTARLAYEIFSEASLDQIVFGEIAL